ncbi:MAG: SH3 domain-containing protein [Lachnospiraceae bacterium]|nr:SH3 domain-containing protein [Lachnospiraceae bacterium]MCX4376933.1 cell wall hydrolase [Lachnospiraceae bacterium]
MKSICKKWKYLSVMTAIMMLLTILPVDTKAADTKVEITDEERKEQETTGDKTDSAAIAAGAAALLDKENAEGDEQADIQVEESNLAQADNNESSSQPMVEEDADMPESAVEIVEEDNTMLAKAAIPAAESVKEQEPVSSETAITVGAAAMLEAQIVDEEKAINAYVTNRAMEPEAKLENSTLVMAKVNQYVNIRESASQESEKVGVLYKDCGGEVLETQQEWTKISSGDVTGWILNEYLYFGNEAKELASDVGILTAHANTQLLRVRKDANKESEIIGLLSEGEAVEAISEEGDWVSVSYEGTKGYVSSEFVNVEFTVDKAESMEVIKAREEVERARREAEAAASRNAKKEAVLATASELEILAALIQCEAGGEPYEGQIAVGAVVMNRVRSGGYPNSITEVIYASGQFVPASKGKMESLILEKNIRSSCVQAAQEAISGTCNVGDALHFRRKGNRQGLIIGNHVFW